MGGIPGFAGQLAARADGRGLGLTQQWRPPQWQRPAMVTLTVPAQSTALPQSGSTQSGAPLYATTVVAQTTYVFDAVLSLEHEQRLIKTQHPVQTGADLSSHAYLMPARVVLYVGMSDVMQSYQAGADPAQPPYIQPWTGNPSKSVSCYQQVVALQAARQPLTLTTRLRTYTNMLITGVSPQEDSRTITGLRMRVELEQIFTASISTVPVSARPQDTTSTTLGAVTTQSPSSSILSQYGVTSNPVNIPGAGTFTGNAGQQALP